MNTINKVLYLNSVDRMMDKLRAACLGQDTHLLDALPTHLRTESKEHCAAYLSRQILFALVIACDDDRPSEQYERSREWLYETILFLLRECNQEDQTFYELGEIMKLSQGVRVLLLSEKPHAATDYTALSKDETMPWPLKELDLAILLLLETLKLDKKMKQQYQKAESLLSEVQSNP